MKNLLIKTSSILLLFLIMKSADKKTKWSPEKENLFNELRKNITLKENNKFYVDFFGIQ